MENTNTPQDMFDARFYKEPYRATLETEAVELIPWDDKQGLWGLVTADTIFYPEGGGQPGDRGTIELDGESYAVIDTQRKDGTIYHILETEPEKLGAAKLAIDWDRRYDFMQQHSGEHLISGICHQLKGYENVGFHISEDVMVIDFDGPLTKEEIREIENRANEGVFQNLPIAEVFPSPEEAEDIHYRSKKEVGENLRLITVAGYDTCACCGVQLSRTGEIGLIRIRNFQKHRGGMRVEAVCGRRALKMFQEESDVLDELVQIFSEPVENLTAAATDRLEQLTAAKNRLVEERLVFLNKEAAEKENREKASFVVGDFSSQDLKETAKHLSEQFSDFAAVLQPLEGDTTQFVMAQAKDSASDFNLRELLNEMKEKFEVRGGGQPAFVQGQILAPVAEVEAYLAERFAL